MNIDRNITPFDRIVTEDIGSAKPLAMSGRREKGSPPPVAFCAMLAASGLLCACGALLLLIDPFGRYCEICALLFCAVFIFLGACGSRDISVSITNLETVVLAAPPALLFIAIVVRFCLRGIL